jgi:hypothetical protein
MWIEQTVRTFSERSFGSIMIGFCRDTIAIFSLLSLLLQSNDNLPRFAIFEIRNFSLVLFLLSPLVATLLLLIAAAKRNHNMSDEERVYN